MGVSFGFYNSLNGDRKYDAEQVSQMFDGLINDGVYQSIGSAFFVSSTGGLTFSIGSGRSWTRHTWTLNDSALVMSLGASEALLNRYDAIVLDVDSATRTNAFRVVQGTPASNPTYPSLINTENRRQYPLAYVYRSAGSTSVTQANFTNRIGTSDFPFVTGVLSVIDITTFLTQWQAQWNAWFNSAQTNATNQLNTWMGDEKAAFDIWFEDLQVTLDTNVATSLAARLLEVEGKLATLEKERVIYGTLIGSDGTSILDATNGAILAKSALKIG